MKDFFEKVIVILALVAICILGLLLLPKVDPELSSALGSAIATFFDGLWHGIIIIFFVVLALAVITAIALIFVRVYHRRDTHVVYDKKEGQPVRAIIHKGELVQIAPAGMNIAEVMQLQAQQAAQMKQYWQMFGAATASMGKMAAYLEQYEVVDANEDEYEEIDEAEALMQIEGPAIDPLTACAPTFCEELESGVLDEGQPFPFGYRIVTDPFTRVTSLEPITDAHTATLFLAGWSRTGKSTLVAGAMARRALTQRNVAFLVLDPHKGAPSDSLTAQIAAPFADWLIRPKGGEKITGKKPSEVNAVVSFLKQEVGLRLERTDLTPEQKRQVSPYFDLDIWFIVDEALSYARETRLPGHEKVFDELLHLLQKIATDGSKVGITGLYMTQLSTKEQLGDIEIKDACPRRVILKAPRDQGKALGLTGPEAVVAERFPRGRGYYMLDGMEQFVWGYASPEEIAEAMAGVQSPLVRDRAEKKIIPLPSRMVNAVQGNPRLHDQLPYSERELNEDGTQMQTQIESALDAHLQAKVQAVLQAMQSGINTKDFLIECAWGAKKGKGRDYQEACLEYEQVMKIIAAKAMGMQETDIDSQAGEA
jgi:hypothetical protein